MMNIHILPIAMELKIIMKILRIHHPPSKKHTRCFRENDLYILN